MHSLRELYKTGKGPSSSHTMGPNKAAQIFAGRHGGDSARFEVTLYGSLAATGKGHMTDIAILEVLEPIAPTTIVWEPSRFLEYHSNAMLFKAFDAEGSALEEWTVYSIGGGALSEGPGKEMSLSGDVYDMNTLTEIVEWCDSHGRQIWEYVDLCEGPAIWDYLMDVWETMKASVERGLATEGRLPGPLNLSRKASVYHVKALGYQPNLRSRGLVFAYALAVSEENAAGGTIVTAPTCGSCGVMPGVLYHLSHSHAFSDTKIIHTLATAGLVGNVVKQNASISGAEVGCQGEVGVACAMASAAACQLFGGSPYQVEYAAEMGLEHHLGMTCDPICGLVQIPCIERNAFAATRALDANIYSTFSDGRHRISFDHVVEVMKQTGKDLPSLYKETSAGGLALKYSQR
ncbi:MAG: L-serine ammonia-lyase [Bacteroidales bacterium]|nr:L-serine ammonia-lyase [Bacteroidales bacterium]